MLHLEHSIRSRGQLAQRIWRENTSISIECNDVNFRYIWLVRDKNCIADDTDCSLTDCEMQQTLNLLENM